MALTRLRFLSCLLTSLLIFPLTSAAFDTPLSDTAVREAYFLGQRHDESMAHFFDRYYKHLPPPKTGPYISSVSFLTPYALLAQLSSERVYGYSAQQAELDHRKMAETVKILVEIQLTNTYGAALPNPSGQTSGTPWDYIYRPSSFWRDFQIKVTSNKKVLSPFIYTGEPNYICGDTSVQPIALGEYCTLVGATVQLEFLAGEFAPDSATIQIDPPEGDQVTVDFDLTSFR
jgi:hypothetical protein